MDTLLACLIVEGMEETDEDGRIDAWQYLINTGTCWGLQGWYGRTASALIKAGVCHAAITTDEELEVQS